MAENPVKLGLHDNYFSPNYWIQPGAHDPRSLILSLGVKPACQNLVVMVTTYSTNTDTPSLSKVFQDKLLKKSHSLVVLAQILTKVATSKVRADRIHLPLPHSLNRESLQLESKAN